MNLSFKRLIIPKWDFTLEAGVNGAYTVTPLNGLFKIISISRLKHCLIMMSNFIH